MQGKTLSHHKTRHVNLTVGTQGQRVNNDFQVADISDNILSLEKLLRNGFVFRLNCGNDSIMYHRNDPTSTVKLFLHNKSLRILARPLIHHVSGQFLKHECESNFGPSSEMNVVVRGGRTVGNFCTLLAQVLRVRPWFAFYVKQEFWCVQTLVQARRTVVFLALQFVLCTVVTGATFTLSCFC